MPHAVANAKFVRGTAGIAKCLGFRLGKRQLAAKCREIAEWIQREDFPKKTRHGWVIDEVVEWGKKFAAELAPKKAEMAAMAEVLSSERPSKRAVLLVTAANGAGGEVPSVASGLSAIAKIIANHFGVTCVRQYVYDWRHGEKLPPGAPPFPPPRDSNRFNVAECLAWYEKWQMPHQRTGQSDLFAADLPAARSKAEIERLAHEAWLRAKDRGGWMEVAEHNRVAAGLGKLAWGEFCEVAEKRLPGSLLAILNAELGIRSAELGGAAAVAELVERILAEFRARCQAEVDGVQRKFQERVEELKKQTTNGHQ